MNRFIFSESGAALEVEESGQGGAIVLILPGGGYERISPRESAPVAKAFKEKGFVPAVLSYSVSPEENGSRASLGTLPLREAAWAVRTLREAFGQTAKIAVCGFSAGGHLAASLGVHWDSAGVFAEIPDRKANRPDALVLCYPVITAGKYAHSGSFEKLAGDAGLEFFSLEKHVSEKTPPAFIWHTAADESVPAENSLLFANALLKSRVAVELHVYPYGAHGLSLATSEVEDPQKNRLPDPHVAGWLDLCAEWLGIILK